MKITLFLMTKKGSEVLNSIIKNSFHAYIEKVIVGIDKSVINDYSEEIIQLCEINKIVYFISNQKYEVNTTFAIAISWRWLIHSENFKLIIIHDSLLPKYRGFAPLVNSLINKEELIGLTALFASDEYDKGEIISQKQISISYPIKINEAIEKISVLYSIIVLDILKKIISNIQLESFSQNEEVATYSLWRDEEDYFINWNDSSTKIERFIDAVGYPYQGAKCYLEKQIIIILKASPFKDVIIENRNVGKIIFIQENLPIVVCGTGLLKINEAVFENSKKSIFPLKKFRNRFK